MKTVQDLITKTTYLSGVIRSFLNSGDSKLSELIKDGFIKLKEHTDSIEFIYFNNYNGFLLISSLHFLAYDNCAKGVRVQYRLDYTDRFVNLPKMSQAEFNGRYCRKDLELINSEDSKFDETLTYIRKIIKEFVAYIDEDKIHYYNTRNKKRFELFQKLGTSLERITLDYEYLRDMKPYIKWYKNKRPDEHYYFDNKFSIIKAIKSLFNLR